ncbi:MAG: adenosylmethionine--8-amino-7-oxononanoate transaminase [Opitutales bacterium]
MNIDSLLAFDREHICHPYASMTGGLEPYFVESANGVRLKLAKYGEVIDGMSSWWAVVNGYNHPVLNLAMTEQLGKMSHVMFGGLTHEKAIMLGEKLLSVAPSGLTKVFYSDSGSVSIEVAMKLAMQYAYSIGTTKKTKFATIRGGYHGDTWNAMSVCDPVNGMHNIFAGRLPINFFVDRPLSKFDGDYDESDILKVRQLFEESASEIAGFIVEPIVQGAGGMYFYNAQYLRDLKALCEEFSVLLILDEIATGFCRTGKFFACEHAGISADIMCLGKAITGGYMSFAATLCSDSIAEVISNSELGLFMHGPTFMANPLACAVACASFDLVMKEETLNRISQVAKILKIGLAKLKQEPNVADARCLGAIAVVEMKENINVAKAQKILIENGVWLRPFGKLLYAMPPYIISDAELAVLLNAMRKTVRELL